MLLNRYFCENSELIERDYSIEAHSNLLFRENYMPCVQQYAFEKDEFWLFWAKIGRSLPFPDCTWPGVDDW